jgi:iron complex transport system substrate-binding protein
VEEGAPSQKTCCAPQTPNPSRKEDSLLRRSLIVVATLIVVLAVAPFAAARGTADFPIVIHAANGDVTVKQRPTRIVSLSPTATESLFAIGAGQQVVAVDDQSDYPKQAPRTSLSGFTPNVEAIAAYKPDLVIVGWDAKLVTSLEKLGITAVYQPAANNVAEAYDQIRELGQATGRTPRAAALVRSMQKTLTALIRSVPKKSRHLKVFHELGPDYFSATSATFIGRIYKLFGFRNIADAADTTNSGYPQLSAEYLLSANPDIVVLADSVCCGQTAAGAAERPGWTRLAAVQRKRVIAVDDSVASRWGPRIVAFARVVAQAARRS